MTAPRGSTAALALATLCVVLCAAARVARAQGTTEWPMHSMARPQPRVVDPGPGGPPRAPPSDAIVLFDGRSLDGWRSAGNAGGPARWTVRDGYVEVAAGTGAIASVREFGDVQLHIEWATPRPPSGEGQARGNSGVFFMGRYEVQVLDSYRSTTYPDGQAGAIYGQHPPLVNASRQPGEWQTYDMIFRRPRFDSAGTLVEPARLTVLHNGVLIHDAAVLVGPTSHQVRTPYAPHPDRLPIELQDHGDPVRFRNIWVRELWRSRQAHETRRRR